MPGPVSVPRSQDCLARCHSIRMREIRASFTRVKSKIFRKVLTKTMIPTGDPSIEVSDGSFTGKSEDTTTESGGNAEALQVPATQFDVAQTEPRSSVDGPVAEAPEGRLCGHAKEDPPGFLQALEKQVVSTARMVRSAL